MIKNYQFLKKSVVLAFCILFLTPIYSFGVFLGPGTLPDWLDGADVKLGWQFDDPTNPQNTSPLSEANVYVGSTAPVWSYDASRTAYSMPGQWYIEIPNLVNDNPYKNFYISWVYQFDPLVPGTRTATNIDWPGTDPDFGNFQYIEEYFLNDGTPTTNQNIAGYARITNSLDLYPSPDYEQIWLGVVQRSGGPAKYATEVYIATRSVVPIPPAVYLMGSGLVGLIGIKRRMSKGNRR